MPRDNTPDPMGQTLTAALRFALDMPANQVPASSLETAALLLLDTLGVCVAAQPMEAGRIARDAACRLYGASNPEDKAPMLFDGRQVSRAGAAYAAASQIDNLDAHDGYNPTKGHIGVAAVPALCAIAHGREDMSGPDALAALVVGYEIAGRAGISLHDSVSDYHTSGAWNALGVAATAARLKGLSPEALRHAWGIAEYHGPRSQMMREIANPTMLHDGSGMGALVGVSSVILAEMGFTGAPALTLEDPQAAAHWSDLGAFWQTDHQYIKPYPICRWAHAPIDAVRSLKLEHGFGAEDIAGIEVRSFHNAVQLYREMPDTTSKAQYSLDFAVGIMAAYGTIELRHISGDGLSDPTVSRLVDATTAIEDASYEAKFPEGRWAEVAIQLKSGDRLESGSTHARGGPERPMSREEIIGKFMAYSVPVLGEERSKAIRESALSLTSSGFRFSDLEAHLYDGP